MTNLMTKLKTKPLAKLILILTAVVGSVALPQIVHWIGAAAGIGTALGEVLLPMHFFVLLAGLLGGPTVGIATGVCAPLLSTLLSGMPKEAMLPFILAEVAGYGLIAGLMACSKKSTFLQLLVAQLGGRAVRGLVFVIAGYVLQLSVPAAASVWGAIANGWPGILLQWCLLPPLVYCLKGSSHE